MSNLENNLDYYYCCEDFYDDEDTDEWNEFDSDDDEWCRELDLPSAKQRRIESESDVWSDNDDAWCGEMALPTGDTTPHQEGGALFEFTLTQGEMPRRWKNIVNKTRHTARLHQRRDATYADHLGGSSRRKLYE